MEWLNFDLVFHRGQELREPGLREVHLLPGILRQHLAAIGRDQGVQNLSSILLERLRIHSLKPGDPLSIIGPLPGGGFLEIA